NAVPVPTPSATFAERQLIDAAYHDAVREIIGPDSSFIRCVRFVEEGHLFDYLRPGVVRQDREPAGKAPLRAELPGVIGSLAVVTPRANPVELRDRTQKLLPLNGRAIEIASRQ